MLFFRQPNFFTTEDGCLRHCCRSYIKLSFRIGAERKRYEKLNNVGIYIWPMGLGSIYIKFISKTIYLESMH